MHIHANIDHSVFLRFEIPKPENQTRVRYPALEETRIGSPGSDRGTLNVRMEISDQVRTYAPRFNIAEHLTACSTARPDQAAIILDDPRAIRFAGRDRVTFAELEEWVNHCASGFAEFGITKGTRTLVMVRPGFEFFVVVFALFKVGAVPVMIDPGMGVSRLVECAGGVDLEAFVGIPLAQGVRVLRPAGFRGVKHIVTVGPRLGWGGVSLSELYARGDPGCFVSTTRACDPAAILFTSGSTGPAKGVVYEHGMFDAQIRMIQSAYAMQPGEVDVPTFPLFGLFSLAMGMTVVIPEMDASRPVRADPAKIVRAITAHGATNTFGSPALWRNVAAHCVSRGIKLPSLRRILIAGAPVSVSLIEQLHQVLAPDADVHTPFGATESLPVASIAGRERVELARTAPPDAGTCVGRPVNQATVRIVRITDEPIAAWSDELLVGDGKIGEIVVSGPMVTREYYAKLVATAGAKIIAGDTVWHRMGDVGYFDRDGRLWYCGRKSQRVVTAEGTLFTDCVEGVFNAHPDVARSALVGVGRKGRQTPVVVVELKPGKFPSRSSREPLAAELLAFAQATANRQPVGHVLFCRSLPVDGRHNAKINREALCAWAEARTAFWRE